MLPVTRCNIARGDGWYEKASCNPLSDTAEMESRSNFENLRADYCGDVHYLNYFTNSFYKNVLNTAVA